MSHLMYSADVIIKNSMILNRLEKKSGDPIRTNTSLIYSPGPTSIEMADSRYVYESSLVCIYYILQTCSYIRAFARSEFPSMNTDSSSPSSLTISFPFTHLCTTSMEKDTFFRYVFK